jgi:ribonucleoside-diphosphate reductase alpha chain
MLDILALINFATKEESIQLANERGSCGAMDTIIGNRYFDKVSHLETLYGDLETSFVSGLDWRNLASTIRSSGKLRNISTLALPPTGRSALVVDASTGIEPHFRMSTANEYVRDSLGRHVANGAVHAELHADATMIRPLGHILMAAELQRATDEAISKTINLASDTSSQEIIKVYEQAHAAGMSGVTIYVDGTFGNMQPLSLDKVGVR